MFFSTWIICFTFQRVILYSIKKANLFFQLLEILALVEPQGRSDPLAAVYFVLQRVPRASFYVFLTDLESSDSAIFTEAAIRARAMNNHITIILETEDPISGINCSLTNDYNLEIDSLYSGKQIIIKGVCSGKLIDVVLNNCLIIEKEKQ